MQRLCNRIEPSSIKIYSRCKGHKVNSNMAQLRPLADKFRKIFTMFI